MNYIDQEFNSLENDPKEYQEDYESHYNFMSKTFLLMHTLDYLLHIKKEIRLNKNQGKSELDYAQFKNIQETDSAIYLAKIMARQLQQIMNLKEDNKQFDGKDIAWTLIKTFKKDIIKVFLYNVIGNIARLAFSIVILYLFNCVNEGNLNLAYIYAAIILSLWYISQTLRQYAFIESDLISSRIIGGLSMILYAKISSLSSYVVKSSELGKLTNMLASDFSVFQIRLASFFFALSVPIVVIGATIILIVRLGWPGILGIVMVLLMIPISNWISKGNGEIIQHINIYKDKRIQTCTEINEGIRFIKLYGWQMAFKRTIQKYRSQQIEGYKKLSFGRSIERAFSNSIALWSSFVIFLVFHYAGTVLDFPKIFSTLELLSNFKYSLVMFGLGLGFFYEILVVFDRFANILNIAQAKMVEINPKTKEIIQKQTNNKLSNAPNIISNQTVGNTIAQLSYNKINIKPANLTHQFLQEMAGENISAINNLEKGQIIFQKFNGYWKKERNQASLKDINLHFKKGKFYGICGKVGSGKSGVLGVILQQIPYYSGKFDIQGSISYVEQEPIIFSKTIRQNILFGRSFNQQLYGQAIHMSCLSSDIEIFEQGDAIMVGEKGVTLSGGQKARLSLARAVYADSDIYLLDDPISAVDSKVAREIYQRCLLRLSRSKTVILVTHQVSYLSKCDEVIILDNGAVTERGTPQELKRKLEEINLIFRRPLKSQEEEDSEIQQQASLKIKQEIKNQLVEHLKSQEKESVHSEIQLKIGYKFKEMVHQVTWGTYFKFFFINHYNKSLFPLAVLFFFITEGITTLYYRFLVMYSQILAGLPNIFNSNFNYFWGILGLLMVLYFIVTVIKDYLMNVSILLSNQKIHEEMINGLVRSPSSFFDKTPSGQLINKFSNDLGILDNSLSFCLFDALEGLIMTIVAFVNICQINVYFIPPAIILLVILTWYFHYSRQAIISCRQTSLKSKNPVFHTFNESSNGVTQIKIYGRRKALLKEFSMIANTYTKATMASNLVSKGFGFYAGLIEIFLLVIGLYIGIYQSDSYNAALYGITVIYLITFNQSMQWSLRQLIAFQSLMLSAERAFQIIDLPSEKDLRNLYDAQIGLVQQVEAAQRDEDLHQIWPDEPSLCFESLSAKYNEEMPLILKDVSFSVGKCEKIGIVGRTGAGKSSIIQALFRIFQPEMGSKYNIGGNDALRMGLHSLRQHISVIPQTPFLFKGSVRQNIDPFTNACDEEIWKVLGETDLRQHIQSLPKQLQTDISNTSESLSVGQKQLLCLSRALLRRNRFLVLDEATSNVDMKTDHFIQQVIKEKFRDTTVITIAHRLNTIADYDKVIVLHGGRIVEMGSPHSLIEAGGTFSEMVSHTGMAAEHIRQKARLKQASIRE